MRQDELLAQQGALIQQQGDRRSRASSSPRSRPPSRSCSGTSSASARRRCRRIATTIRDPARRRGRSGSPRCRRAGRTPRRSGKLVARTVEHKVPEAEKTCPKCGGHDFSPLGDGQDDGAVRPRAGHRRAADPHPGEAPLPLRRDRAHRPGAGPRLRQGPVRPDLHGTDRRLEMRRRPPALPPGEGVPARRRTDERLHARRLLPPGGRDHQAAVRSDCSRSSRRARSCSPTRRPMRVQAKGKTAHRLDLELHRAGRERQGTHRLRLLAEPLGRDAGARAGGHGRQARSPTRTPATTASPCPASRERAGCLAHLRRKFFDALGTAPEAAQKAMDFILDVYRIERIAIDDDVLGTPEHLEMRKDQSRAVDGSSSRRGSSRRSPVTRRRARWARPSATPSDSGRRSRSSSPTRTCPSTTTRPRERSGLRRSARKNFLFVGTRPGRREPGRPLLAHRHLRGERREPRRLPRRRPPPRPDPPGLADRRAPAAQLDTTEAKPSA